MPGSGRIAQLVRAHAFTRVRSQVRVLLRPLHLIRPPFLTVPGDVRAAGRLSAVVSVDSMNQSRTVTLTVAVAICLGTVAGCSDDSGNTDAGSPTTSDRATRRPRRQRPSRPSRPRPRPPPTGSCPRKNSPGHSSACRTSPPGTAKTHPTPTTPTRLLRLQAAVHRQGPRQPGLHQGRRLVLRTPQHRAAPVRQPRTSQGAFDALTSALASCTGETYKGTKLTYAPMSAPKVGDASVGVKIKRRWHRPAPNLRTRRAHPRQHRRWWPDERQRREVTSLLEAQVDEYQAAAAQ